MNGREKPGEVVKRSHWKNRIIGSDIVDPKSLQPNELNWRKHPDRQAKALSGTLDTLGWISDIIVNTQTGRMIDGHLRVELAIENKETEVPVKYVDLSPEEEEMALLTLDPIGAMAEADKNLLEALLNTVKTDDERIKGLMDSIGQDYKIKKEVQEDDYEPPAEIETEIQRGDIFQLGKHRVMCGDSTSEDDVALLMDGKKGDICFTSPPYNAGCINQKDNPRTHKKYISINDELSETEYDELLMSFFRNCKTHSDEQFINVGMVQDNKKSVFKFIYKNLDVFKDIIYWVKDSCSPHIQDGVINNRVEFIIGFGNDKRRFKNPQFKQGTYWNVIEGKPSGNWGSDVKNEYHKIHKATFPIYLPSNIIENFSEIGSNILDPFLGSGTTLIACEQLDRICYGMEISPQYCEIICQRWEKLTGKQREKVRGVST